MISDVFSAVPNMYIYDILWSSIIYHLPWDFNMVWFVCSWALQTFIRLFLLLRTLWRMCCCFALGQMTLNVFHHSLSHLHVPYVPNLRILCHEQAGDKSKKDPLCPGAQGTSKNHKKTVGTWRAWMAAAPARQRQAANALLLKVNQIGSITEAITAYLDSVSAGWGVMVRSLRTFSGLSLTSPKSSPFPSFSNIFGTRLATLTSRY